MTNFHYWYKSSILNVMTPFRTPKGKFRERLHRILPITYIVRLRGVQSDCTELVCSCLSSIPKADGLRPSSALWLIQERSKGLLKSVTELSCCNLPMLSAVRWGYFLRKANSYLLSTKCNLTVQCECNTIRYALDTRWKITILYSRICGWLVLG